MRITFFLLIVALVLSPLCTADEVVLKDGRRLYGEVQKSADHIVVIDFQGRAVVLTDEVKEVKGLDRLREEYKYMLGREGENPNHTALGMWCWKRGLKEEGQSHFQKVLAKNPENRAARWALGQVQVKGIWVQAGVWTALPGEADTWIRYVPEGFKGKIQVHRGRKPSDARDLVRRVCRGTPEERKSASASFAALPKVQKQEGLVLALADRSSRVRQHAAAGLATFPGKETTRALARTALVDRVKKVRSAALDALVEGKAPEAKYLIMEGLTSKHLSVRLNAIRGLTRFPARDAVNALVTVMETSKVRIPRANIFVGRQLSYVRDFDVEVAAFAGIGDPVMGRVMEGAVLDVKVMAVTIRAVRVQQATAYHSLLAVSGKKLPAVAEVWRRWAAERYGS